MKQQKPMADSWGQFLHNGKEVVYVDQTGRQWTAKNIGDLISVYACQLRVARLIDHYKKYL